MGESGEGQMIAHQAKKMTQDSLKQFRDRFDIQMPDDKIADMPYISLAPGSPEMKYLQARRAALGGYLPQRRRKSAALKAPPLVEFRAPAAKLGRARDLDDDGVRADARHAGARQDARQVHRSDRAGRIAHVRDGGDVPPARHLFRGGPAVQAAGRRPADVLPRGQGGAGAAGGHQRSGGDELVDRGRRRRTAPATCR